VHKEEELPLDTSKENVAKAQRKYDIELYIRYVDIMKRLRLQSKTKSRLSSHLRGALEFIGKDFIKNASMRHEKKTIPEVLPSTTARMHQVQEMRRYLFYRVR
jgi:hypothetical protein